MSILQVAFPVLLLLLAGYASFVDVRTMIIPDGANLAIFVTGLAASILVGPLSFMSVLTASVLGGGLMLALEFGFRAHRGYDGLGRGDVKFVAAAATWTGAEGLPIALLAASIAGLVYVLGRRLLDTGFDGRERVPFGPFLAFGAVAVASLQIWSGMSWTDLLDRILL